MKDFGAGRISAAAASELARQPDEVDNAITDARITRVDQCVAEVLAMILVGCPETRRGQVMALQEGIQRLLERLMLDTVAAERSSPHIKRQRARSRARMGGRVRKNQSRKKLVLEWAEKIDAERPGMKVGKLAELIKERVAGVELSSVKKYVSQYRRNCN